MFAGRVTVIWLVLVASTTASEVDLDRSIRRGVEFLCRTQRADGAWGGPQWTGGVDSDPVPGAFHSFDVAVTAMCLEALLDVGGAHPDIPNALHQAESFLTENLPELRRADPENLPNVWGYAYGIQALVKLHQRTPPEDAAKRDAYEHLIRQAMAGLQRFETVHGGWFYYARSITRKPDAPSCSFVNAAVLVALARARQLGMEPDAGMVQRALQSLRLQRKPDFSYLYSLSTILDQQGAMHEINRPAGSLGRTQACNLACRLWGDDDVTDPILRRWLERLITRNGWLEMGRKRPIPHESHAQVAGYFFYFGHYYAGLTIDELPETQRPDFGEPLAALIVPLQEPDGSWFDYPLYRYHKPYGTAFALMTLGRCRAASPKSH